MACLSLFPKTLRRRDGTKLSVKKIMNNIIEATILNGNFKGEEVQFPRIPMIQTYTLFELKHLKLPVRLAFAMTFNKHNDNHYKCVN